MNFILYKEVKKKNNVVEEGSKHKEGKTILLRNTERAHTFRLLCNLVQFWRLTDRRAFKSFFFVLHSRRINRNSFYGTRLNEVLR